MENAKEYYAFISYKREDEEWAKWLQHKLEHFKLPSKLNGRTDLPKAIRPIFKDTSELNPGNLPQQIHNALEQSKHLIVICSPRSAKSEWVNKEVETFIGMGKTDFIIPFIIEGKTFANNPEEECFPESIRNLPSEQEILGANISEMGRDAAAVKVVAQMLGLKFDALWQRYEREQKRKKRIVVFGITAFAMVALGVAGWIWRQNVRLKEKDWKMMENQARFVAEKASNLIDEGDSYTAQRILLEVLPKNIENPIDRPYVDEVEPTFRKAVYCNSVINKDVPCEFAYYSPDGNKILVKASLSDGIYGSVYLYDVRTRVFKALHSDQWLLAPPVFSPDGSRIAVFSNMVSEVTVYDANTLEELCSIDDIAGTWLSGSSIFSPDGEKMVLSSDDTIRIWNVMTGEEIGKLDMSCFTKCDEYYSSFSSDGKHIISSLGNKIVIWDSESGKIVQCFDENASSPSFSPDGNYILYTEMASSMSSWNEDAAPIGIILMDASTGETVRKMDIPQATASCYATFSPQGKWIAVLLMDDDNRVTTTIFDAKTGELVRNFENLSSLNFIKTTSFSPDEKRFFYASSDNYLHICDINKSDELLSWKGNQSEVKSVHYNHKGDRLVSVSSDNSAVVWDEKTGKEVVKLDHRNGIVSSAEFSPDDALIVMACNNLLYVCDAQTGRIIDSLMGHSRLVNSAVFSPDGKFIASASDDCDVIVWDIETRKAVQTFEGIEQDMANAIVLGLWDLGDEKQSAVFSPNGEQIAITSGRHIVIEDVRTKDTLQCFFSEDSVRQMHVDGRFQTAFFNPDGDLIVSASDDKTVKVWSVETGDVILTLSGHSRCVNSAKFSPDGNYIVSASDDGTVKVWDVKTGKEIQTYQNNSEAITHAEFSPEGGRIVSSSTDVTICIWEFLPFQQLVDQARERFKDRPLTPEERHKYYLE